MSDLATGALTPELERGLAAVKVSEPVRAAARRALTEWLTDPAYTAFRPLLERLIADQAYPLLVDAFYQVLPFGTGGRRGPVGPGPNRFNPMTLASSVAGHIEFLRDRFGQSGIRVVIGYDSRAFSDVRGLYPKDLGPLAGLTSRTFAELAARVYTSAGVDVYLSARIMATPELSFAIRELGAQGGLVVSASHNPPDDNGGKFYDHRGGQEVPPEDQAMVDRVAGVARVEATGDPMRVTPIPDRVHTAYVATNLGLRVRPDAERGKIGIVYTPLHGTGVTTVGDVLKAAGFEPVAPAGQDVPDGRFPTVPFGIANPEVPESMQLAVEEAKRRGADLVLATDPDADRIGAVVPDEQGSWRFLTGNEIGALVVNEVLVQRRKLGTLPAHPLVIKTEVTSEFITRVAQGSGAAVIGDLLVGFKYVAAVLDTLEREGRYRDLRGQPGDFVAGIEESHGVLLTPAIRDKDAAGAALILAELAARVKAEKTTIPAVLAELERRYGVVVNRLTSMVMRGAAGKEAIDSIQNALRRQPPAEIGGRKVVRFVDHWDERPGSRFGPIVSETDRAARNVLVFELAGEGRVIIRPSGTEPKNKTYIEAASPPLAAGADLAAIRAQVAAEARALEEGFVHHCLGLIGVELPAFALKISGLVALDEKRDFATRFLPDFEAEARTRAASGDSAPATGAALAAWIDRRLKAYGQDPRLLTGDAFLAWHAEQMAKSASDPGRRRMLELMQAAWQER
jgi:phosphoglucomutase/phosphomannomutase